MMLARLVARDHILATVLVIAASAVCARLGIWQLDRLSQRRAFNQRVTTVREMPELTLPSSEPLLNQEYRSVHASGTYDFGDQIAIRNQFHNGEYGFHLVTPLMLDGGQSTDGALRQVVLVDRGWIPAAGNGSSADWSKYDVSGDVSVEGVVRLSELPPSFAGLAEPTPSADQGTVDFWTVIDIARLQKQIGYPVLPIYVQQISPAHAGEPPIPEPLTLDLSQGPHLGYAIQWFGFAALFAIGYPLYVRRQEGHRR
jgi:surfeit locus 1 family protein